MWERDPTQIFVLQHISRIQYTHTQLQRREKKGYELQPRKLSCVSLWHEATRSLKKFGCYCM